MRSIFDTRQVRRAFSRSACNYTSAASLQREIESRLLDSLDYLDDPALQRAVPTLVVDLGSGPGHASHAMCTRWPQAQVLALDLALPMLRQAQHMGSATGDRAPLTCICADARALPLAEGTVDVLFSNLCLQWLDDLPTVLAGFRRVMRPGGLLLASTFGRGTLSELRTAFAQADAVAHVSPFATMAEIGDALVQAGFRDPVLDRDVFVHTHQDLPELMRSLRALGATNALHARRHTLTGKARFAAAANAYQRMRGNDGLLPASWEAIYVQAWAPAPGAPIREAGLEIAAMPVAQIPIRRRSR